MAEEGCDGNLFDGKIFQNDGGGGTWYVDKVGMSGHFLSPESGTGGAGKDILVSGLSHFLTTFQSLGMPSLTLPSPGLNSMP
jgi:hypothetical protein